MKGNGLNEPPWGTTAINCSIQLWKAIYYYKRLAAYSHLPIGLAWKMKHVSVHLINLLKSRLETNISWSVIKSQFVRRTSHLADTLCETVCRNILTHQAFIFAANDRKVSKFKTASDEILLQQNAKVL